MSLSKKTSTLSGFKSLMTPEASNEAAATKRLKRRALFKKTFPIYVMIFPVLLYFLFFTYIPTAYGFLISFMRFRLVGKSDWIGFANYIEAFTTPGFWNAFFNTLIIGFGGMLVGIPVAVGTAVLLNEILNPFWKRFIQTSIYLPHLFGWVVIAGLWMYILAPDYGLFNILRVKMGMEPILYMVKPEYGKLLV
ncbi:MAG: hypothetical protein AB1798_16590, partial [Spirochaetota bacterium]